MNKKNHILGILIIPALLLTSCKRGISESTLIAKHFKKIDINFEQLSQLPVSAIAKSIEYIPLETSPKSDISEIDKIAVCDSLYFVMDNRLTQTIAVFNKTGKLRYALRKGNGAPGEFRSLTDFSLDISGKFLYVFGNDESLVYKYNALNGKFISYFRVAGYFANIEYLSNNKFLFLRDNFSQFEGAYDDNRICLIDYHGKYLKGWLKTPLNGTLGNGNFGSCNIDNSEILISRHHGDTLYRFTKDETLEASYKVSFGTSSIDQNELFNIKKMSQLVQLESHTSSTVNRIFENKRYLDIPFIKNNALHDYWLDKSTNKGGYTHINNDIDHLPFTSIQYLDNKLLITVMNATMIRNVFNYYSSKGKINNFPKLIELNSQLNQISNPVLCIAHLK